MNPAVWARRAFRFVFAPRLSIPVTGSLAGPGPSPHVVRRSASQKSVNAKLFALLSDGLKMPKEEPHLKPLRTQRSAKRKKHEGTPLSHVYFQVVGNGAAGGARSLFMYTNVQRYLFNCGEGTQRLCIEHCSGRSLAQMGHVFITRKSWENLGGLPGIYLTIRATGSPDVTIHGPEGVMDIYDTVKNFTVLHDFDVLSHDPYGPDYDDSGIRIKQINLKPRNASTPELPQSPKYSDWEERSTPQTLSGEAIRPAPTKPPNLHKPPEYRPYEKSVAAYLITCQGKAGKLQVQKCIELGVPPGPLLGELKAGRDVILDNGVCVRGRDVCEEDSPSLLYLVIEIPSLDFMDSLLAEDALSMERNPDLENIQAIFHFTPENVVRSEPYLTWMDTFPFRCHHVMMNEMNRGYGSHDILGFNQRLHHINPTIFRAIQPDVLGEAIKSDLKTKGYCVNPLVGQKLHVRPHTGVYENHVTDRVNYLEEIDAIPLASYEIAKLSPLAQEVKDAKEYPEVTFLGTASSVPGKYRCVSCILVETKPDNFIIMDCGEGSVLQMHRLFGRKRTLEILRGLKAVYVSHLHADHHLGFINIVQNRAKAFEEIGKPVDKLYVMGPNRMATYLNMYHLKFESVLQDLVQIKNEYLVKYIHKKGDLETVVTQPRAMYPQKLKELCEYCDFEDIVTSRAVHCAGSFCVALSLNNGFKILYTGDTRPNNALVQLGKDSGPIDLLIHEGTMEHHLLEDCKIKKHSTFTEAIGIGEEIGAKFTLLTHFSQRYPKVPTFDEIEGKSNVGVAWDYMAVNPKTLHLIAKSFPSIKLVFSEALDLVLTKKAEFLGKDPESVILDMLSDDDEEEEEQQQLKKSKKRRKS